MEPESVVPQSFESPKTQKSFPLVFTILALIIAGGMVFYVLKSTNTPTNSNQLNNIKPSDELARLKKDTKITVPDIESEKVITVGELPAQISDLFSYQANNVKSKSVVYADGKSGFLVEFDLLKNLRDSYFSLRPKKDWEVLFGVRSGNSALRNLKRDIYTVSMEFTAIDDFNTSIKISVINN